MEVWILRLEGRDRIVAFKRCGVKKIFRVYKIIFFHLIVRSPAASLFDAAVQVIPRG